VAGRRKYTWKKGGKEKKGRGIFESNIGWKEESRGGKVVDCKSSTLKKNTRGLMARKRSHWSRGKTKGGKGKTREETGEGGLPIVKNRKSPKEKQ